MKRVIQGTLVAILMTLSLAPTAHASVRWVCDPPGEEEPVVFVTAADAAAHGINTANAHAGQTFFTQFGEVCTVVR